VLLLFASTAHAEERPFTPRLELAGGSEALLATGNVCERPAGDLVTCSSKAFFPSLALGLRGRILRHWSFGASGAYAWARWSDGITATRAETRVQSRLLRIAADGRWHFVGDERFDPFLELNLGLVRSWTVYERGSEPSAGVTAPSFGTSAGFDFSLLRYLSLGSRLGAHWVLFERQSLTGQRENGSVFSGPTTIWSLGITLTGRYAL
jgi:hypothetical protein